MEIIPIVIGSIIIVFSMALWKIKKLKLTLNLKELTLTMSDSEDHEDS